MKIFIVAICLTLMVLSEANLFLFPCPIGCADSQCSSRGCIRCQPGYCNLYTRQMSVCVHDCGEGKYCYNSLAGPFCTACKVSNCKSCSSANSCQECLYRYELENGECRRKRFG